MTKAIDVSSIQGTVDWSKVKNSGIKAVMIKASQGRSETTPGLANFADSRFSSNVLNAYNAGLCIGAYHYLTAQTVEEAKAEAKLFVDTLTPMNSRINLWAAVDVESSYLPQNAALLTKIVLAFCEVVQNSGFKPCIYTNPSFLKYRLNDISKYPLWLAYWTASNALAGAPADNYATAYTHGFSNVVMWQWGAYRAGSVAGIAGSVDGDIVMQELPKIQKVTVPTAPKYSVGDKVKLTSNAKYTNGKAVPLWVRLLTVYVRAINGNNITFSVNKTGAITGIVDMKYLK